MSTTRTTCQISKSKAVSAWTIVWAELNACRNCSTYAARNSKRKSTVVRTCFRALAFMRWFLGKYPRRKMIYHDVDHYQRVILESVSLLKCFQRLFNIFSFIVRSFYVKSVLKTGLENTARRIPQIIYFWEKSFLVSKAAASRFRR